MQRYNISVGPREPASGCNTSLTAFDGLQLSSNTSQIRTAHRASKQTIVSMLSLLTFGEDKRRVVEGNDTNYQFSLA